MYNFPKLSKIASLPPSLELKIQATPAFRRPSGQARAAPSPSSTIYEIQPPLLADATELQRMQLRLWHVLNLLLDHGPLALHHFVNLIPSDSNQDVGKSLHLQFL